MSYLITLSNDGKNLQYMNFLTRFSKSLNFGNKEMEIGLHELYTWFSFFNCSTELGNNTLQYNNGTTNRLITIPDGNYTLSQLDREIKRQMKAFGDFQTVNNEEIYDINFAANYSTLRVELELKNNYSVDLTISDFNILLGFNKAVYNFQGITVGQELADITNQIENLQLNTDVISGSYTNGVEGNVLYNFKPDTPPGSEIHIVPQNKVFVKLDVDVLKEIRIWITDQLGRPINLNGEGITAVLHIRQRKTKEYSYGE